MQMNQWLIMIGVKCGLKINSQVSLLQLFDLLYIFFTKSENIMEEYHTVESRTAQ